MLTTNKLGGFMLKTLSMVFGVVFLAVGILGFVPGITSETGGDKFLLGIFQVGVLHNIVHIASGAAALLAASGASYAKVYFRVFGTVYAVVAVVGLVQSDTILGLMPINLADNILHVVLALALLAIGFGLPEETNKPTAAKA
jgi:hypothetical protein